MSIDVRNGKGSVDLIFMLCYHNSNLDTRDQTPGVPVSLIAISTPLARFDSTVRDCVWMRLTHYAGPFAAKSRRASM